MCGLIPIGEIPAIVNSGIQSSILFIFCLSPRWFIIPWLVIFIKSVSRVFLRPDFIYSELRIYWLRRIKDHFFGILHSRIKIAISIIQSPKSRIMNSTKVIHIGIQMTGIFRHYFPKKLVIFIRNIICICKITIIICRTDIRIPGR